METEHIAPLHFLRHTCRKTKFTSLFFLNNKIPAAEAGFKALKYVPESLKYVLLSLKYVLFALKYVL
jgi:hypothetical protein